MQVKWFVPTTRWTGLFLALSVMTFCPRLAADDGRQVFGNKDILISRLDKVVDSKLIQKTVDQVNLWKALPYVSEEGSGVMLGEGGGPDQKPITIRLGAKGTYRIFLGLYGGYNAQRLHFRLSKDAAKEAVPIRVKGQRTLVISETFWKEADLTGQDLILEGAADANTPAALAYVRLESVPDRKDSYPMMITNDGHGIFFGPEPTNPQDLLKTLKELPDGNCMRMFFWGNGCADNCNYPTDEQDVHRDDPDRLDFRYFARLPGREKIRLIPLLYPWTKYSSDFDGWKRLIHSYLDQGADAYGVWDAGGARFKKVKDIGTTLKEYKRPDPPPFREIRLRRLQDFRMDRYHYFEVI